MLVGSITDEIDACDLGDAGLKTRLHLITQRLLEKPNMSIPSACNSRAEMEAAYRFFGNPNVTPDEILNAHASASLARLVQTLLVYVLGIARLIFMNFWPNRLIPKMVNFTC
jgi:hypothetical protein